MSAEYPRLDPPNKWYWDYAPFRAEPIPPSNADAKLHGYTHRVAGKGSMGALFRSGPDAERVAEKWNEKAALYCMTEVP